MTVFVLSHEVARTRAIEAVKNAPAGVMVKIQPPKRSNDQSAKFHAMCGEVAKRAMYFGKKLELEQWKVIFISGHAIATGLPTEIVPGIEGEFVNIRERSAAMSQSRMSSLIEYVSAWIAENMEEEP